MMDCFIWDTFNGIVLSFQLELFRRLNEISIRRDHKHSNCSGRHKMNLCFGEEPSYGCCHKLKLRICILHYSKLKEYHLLKT